MLSNAKVIENEISQYATSDARKKIWVLIDGVNMPKDMARLIGKIKVRAVNLFLEDLGKAGLIENPKRKPPQKLINYVPLAWIELFKDKKARKINGE